MASEQDTLRIVQQIYAAFGRGDIPAVLAALSDEIEWQMVFTLREGRVVQFREYDDTAAVAAAFRP